jgi:hypothetical protein
MSLDGCIDVTYLAELFQSPWHLSTRVAPDNNLTSCGPQFMKLLGAHGFCLSLSQEPDAFDFVVIALYPGC